MKTIREFDVITPRGRVKRFGPPPPWHVRAARAAGIAAVYGISLAIWAAVGAYVVGALRHLLG